MIKAGGYVLHVPIGRRKVLLQGLETHGWFGSTNVSEPVPIFAHSRRAPLVVFGCFADDAITHIADGRRGISAGTKLSRLNMTDLASLSQPIPFSKLISRVPTRVRAPLSRVLNAGGKLPPKSLQAVVKVILAIDESLTARLSRFSDARREKIARLTPKARNNLALQKESVGAALQIAGIGTEELLDWSPSDKADQALFLEGMPEAKVREDAMITSDLTALPGFDVITDYHYAAKTFQHQNEPRLKLTIIMANKLPLEQQTGADLIYYNETFKSFVFVQYKVMEKEGKTFIFRWKNGDQFSKEISRMDDISNEIKEITKDTTPSSFRLHENPFFIKICPRVIFNVDDKGLFPGMYLPLEYWRCLANDPITAGPRGGRGIGYDNVGRHLTNTEFVSIVAGAWAGTTVPQSAILSKVIRDILQSGKVITFAVKRRLPPDPDDSAGIDATYPVASLKQKKTSPVIMRVTVTKDRG